MVQFKDGIDINIRDVEVEASIDVSPEDYYLGMNSWKVNEMIDILERAGYLSEFAIGKTYTDDDWASKMKLLYQNKWRMSNEDIETILKIVDKL